MITHKVKHLNSTETVFRLTRKHDDVRYWFNAYGSIVAVWKAKNGRQYAVGHNPMGETIVYRSSAL